MDNKQLIAISILSAKDDTELPAFSALDSEVSKMILELIESFDYTRSRIFMSKIDGKSEAYKQRYLASISEPVKARTIRERFLQSIRDIEISDDIFAYVSSKNAMKVRRIRSLLNRENNS